MNFVVRFFIIALSVNVFMPTGMNGQPGQVAIPRVDKMPDAPAPYNLRNWKQVARQYDSFVYDVSKTGQYLPLISIGAAGVNYPQNKTIILRSYVGTNSPNGSEAVNVLPSLVGATLAGDDKSAQYGQNWLLMSQDFFNKANGENLYLNNAGSNSGDDWWYDLMPNVFFYQLYDLYPNISGDAKSQFTTIADRFLESVRAMGGRDTPWNVPNMDYRAWKFKTMQPNASGVHEPEAAGAYAWVLYNAWKRTGNREYLKGAEWAMEFLSAYPTDPSYELQLPYGTYAAAKMNAELGTNYDVQKMVDWSFDRGPLRGWGTIVGNWGGFDVSGLVGEANDGGNDYAFQLNGVQQAAALIPMVRYDKRFARAIGKWALNLANATRLYYPGFLPSDRQDATAWSNAYDPNQVIGYEALREKWQGLSPFSTGDALRGGWAGTNLSLYSTSSIGYLGSMIEATNVEKILKLDLLKTDFFGSKDAMNRVSTYPTFLLYNPYTTAQSVQFDAGNTAADVYDALTETFIAKNVSGFTNLNIPANQASLVTITPAGGKITYDRNRMLVNNIVVDFNQTKNPYTRSVRIKALAAAKKTIQVGDSTLVYATAVDPDGGVVTYKWSSTNGSVSGTGKTVTWHAPTSAGAATIQVIATDTKGNGDTAKIDLTIVLKINLPPVISDIQKSLAYAPANGVVQLTCLATDPNGDSLTYLWSGNGGSFSGTTGRIVNWTAPATEGVYQINVQVSDNGGLSAQASTSILVKTFSKVPGNLIAYYPFSGNTDDVSGNQLNGVGSGIAFVADRNGAQNSAVYFNGGTQNVTVANSPILNFQDAVTVGFWFSVSLLPDRETFLASHGSWQNRWKISLTPDKRLRWTVNTLATIADLDAPNPIATDSFFHVTATYDGSLMAIYINGNLTAYKALSGKIRTTTLPFLVGQMLPDNTAYNFKGVMDEVKIFDKALIPSEVNALYQQSLTAVKDIVLSEKELIQVSPNPVSDILKAAFLTTANTKTQLQIRDLNGRVLLEKDLPAGAGAANVDVSRLISGVYFISVQMNAQTAVARFVKL